MKEMNINPVPRVGNASDTQAGYLYHKAKPSPRRRHAPKIPSLGKPNPRTLRSQAQSIFRSHVIIFSLVIGFMFLFLYVALFINRKTWEKKEVMALQQITTASEVTPLRSPTPGILQQLDANPVLPARPEMDKDSIRQAMSLADEGQKYEQRGDYERAIKRYREAVDKWPYLDQVWSQLGRAYMQVNDFHRAESALESAVENGPAHADVYNDLGVVLLHLKKTESAMDQFEAAIQIDPKFANSYFNLALCYVAQNTRDLAKESLEKYLEFQPDDPRALKELAFLNASAGNYSVAMENLEKAILAQPEWSPLYLDAAATAALMGNVDVALQYLEKAESMVPAETVYQLFQEPAFKTIRQSEAGQKFQDNLQQRARSTSSTAAPAASWLNDECS